MCTLTKEQGCWQFADAVYWLPAEPFLSKASLFSREALLLFSFAVYKDQSPKILSQNTTIAKQMSM